MCLTIAHKADTFLRLSTDSPREPLCMWLHPTSLWMSLFAFNARDCDMCTGLELISLHKSSKPACSSLFKPRLTIILLRFFTRSTYLLTSKRRPRYTRCLSRPSALHHSRSQVRLLLVKPKLLLLNRSLQGRLRARQIHLPALRTRQARTTQALLADARNFASIFTLVLRGR